MAGYIKLKNQTVKTAINVSGIVLSNLSVFGRSGADR